jgi:hypothetical protein
MEFIDLKYKKKRRGGGGLYSHTDTMMEGRGIPTLKRPKIKTTAKAEGKKRQRGRKREGGEGRGPRRLPLEHCE